MYNAEVLAIKTFGLIPFPGSDEGREEDVDKSPPGGVAVVRDYFSYASSLV